MTKTLTDEYMGVMNGYSGAVASVVEQARGDQMVFDRCVGESATDIENLMDLDNEMVLNLAYFELYVDEVAVTRFRNAKDKFVAGYPPVIKAVSLCIQKAHTGQQDAKS